MSRVRHLRLVGGERQLLDKVRIIRLHFLQRLQEADHRQPVVRLLHLGFGFLQFLHQLGKVFLADRYGRRGGGAAACVSMVLPTMEKPEYRAVDFHFVGKLGDLLFQLSFHPKHFAITDLLAEMLVFKDAQVT